MEEINEYEWLLGMTSPVYIPEPKVALPKKMGGSGTINTSVIDRSLHSNGLSSFMFSYNSALFTEQLTKDNIYKGLSGSEASASIRRIRYRRNTVLNTWTRCMLVDVMIFMENGVTKEDLFLYKRFINWKISIFDWTMENIDTNLEYIKMYTEFQTMCSPGSDIQFPMEDTDVL